MKPASPRPRLLLVDDHPGMLDTIEKLLDDRFNLVGMLSDSKKAVGAASNLCPDLILLDICMPEPNGICIAHTLRQNGLDAKVIFLTVQEDQDYIDAALQAGAQGYVLKWRMHSDLIPAIELVLAGKSFMGSI